MQAILEEVARHAAAQRLEAALQAARAGQKKYPEAPYLHHTTASLLDLTLQFPEALAEYETEMRLNPSYAKSYTGRGITLSKLGRYDEAVTDYRKSLELDPAQPDTAFAAAELLMRLGRREEAEPLFQASLGTPSAEAYFQLGQFRLQAGEPEKAVALFRSALGIDNRHLGALYNLAQAEKRLGRAELAQQLLERHARLAEEHDELNDKQAAAARPGAGAPNLAAVAEVLLRLKRPAEAAAAYERALALAPDIDHALALATLYADAGQSARAQHWTDLVLTRDPENPTALFLRGALLARAGKLAESEAPLERSRARGSWSADAYRLLGTSYFAGDKLELAEKALASAIELDPSSASSWHWYSAIAFKQGKLEDARAALRGAIELEPLDELYHLSLGIVCHKLGDTEGADAAFREAIRLQRVTLFSGAQLERMLQSFGSEPSVVQGLKRYRELREAELVSLPGQH